MHVRGNRWLIALEGVVANLLLGVSFTWSVFRVPLLELFPAWTEAMLSLAFGLHNVFVCLGILCAGQLKLSKRTVFFIFAALVFTGLGGIFFLPAAMPNLSFVLLFALFTVISSFGVGMGINAVQSSTLPWFPNHTGFMSGALYMALGLSSFLLAALSRAALPLYGVKLSFAGTGLLVLVIALLLLADRRAFTLPEALPAMPGATPLANGIAPREMLRSPLFWLLMVWNASARAYGYILLDHAANIAVAFAATALAGMLISPANGFGSLSFGLLLDKLGLKRNMVLVFSAMAASALCLFAGAQLGLSPLIILGLVFGGMTYGGSSSTYAAAIKLKFGEKHFSANFGFSNFSLAAGALVSSFSGRILDASGGDYRGIFIMEAALLIPALACTLMFRKREKTPS
jgi:OFA family oxalate/formate antiporter-like MFS transporter